MITIVGIFICPEKGQPMRPVQTVRALKGAGLEGDRYAIAQGSWNNGKMGKRQVSLISAASFEDTGFEFADSRRNIIIDGIELTTLIGKEFTLGDARLQGVKYCTPCRRPDNLCGKQGFEKLFFERGGLLADVLETGVFSVGEKLVQRE